MRELLNFEYDFTSSDVYGFICCIPKRLFVTIWSTFLDVKIEFIKSLLCFFGLANMAFWSECLTFTTTLIACCLELLDETWSKPFSFQNDTLTITFSAGLYIVWVVCSRAPAMRANCWPCILDLHVFTFINIFESNFQFDWHVWSSSLLLPPKSSSKKVTEYSSERVMALLPFWLICALLSTLVVFPAFVCITENFVSSRYILKLFESRIVIFILVRMVL